MSKKKTLKADFCVIGAGSGGLSYASGAVQMGASVILLERDKMGGDCLNYGCVPSKALLKASKFYHEQIIANELGWKTGTIKNDFSKAMKHVKSVIAAIEPHDSIERFEKLGVKVISQAGKFLDNNIVITDDYKIKAKFYIIATGSKAGIPPIKGLLDTPYLTNESIFDLKELPKRLAIIGGGPIGIEMAQAFHRLGSEVTVLEAFSVLSKDEPEITKILIDTIKSEGITIGEKIDIQSVSHNGTNFEINYKTARTTTKKLICSHLLVAAGRVPNINTLELEKAGIEYNKFGIKVDKKLKTSNKRVFAIGDCTGGLQFTHVAGHHAGIAIRNSIFKIPTAPSSIVPWVTYTDPELAHVGSTSIMLKKDKIPFETVRVSYSKIDRAIAEKSTTGEAIAHIGKKGKILGVTFLGLNAGELIYPWVIAMQNNLSIKSIASSIAPYPTLSDISKQLAGQYYTKIVFSKKMKKIVRVMLDRFS